MIVFAILTAVLAGALLPILKPKDTVRRIYVSAATVLTVAFAAVYAWKGKSFTLFSMAEGLDITFAVDGISKIFTAVISVSWILVMIYAFTYIKHEGHDDRFFAFYLISLGMLFALAFSANLVTMYLSFELVTLMSMPLVLHSGEKSAVAAALKYLFYSIAGGFMGLFGIFFIYNATGGAFTVGGNLTADSKWLPVALLLAIVGFGTKAGMYPMHGWLPTAHPVAPAPASAVLSAVIAKAGIIAVIRVVFYSVGADYVRGSWVGKAWLVLAMITVVMGSAMAYREKVLKKRLAYSTVSNVSYVMLGLATLTVTGVTGSIMHVIAHALAKNALFLCAGAIIYKTGRTNVDDLTGIGKRMPVTMGCFTVASLSLIGIPPMAGFVSKWSLALGGASMDMGAFDVLVPVCLIISALLTAGYLFVPVINAFFPGRDFTPEKKDEAPLSMTVPMIIFCALSVIVGVLGGPITSAIEAVVAPLI